MQKITTLLMFDGRAQEAMDFYRSLFDDSEVVSSTRYGSDGPGVPGSVKHATFRLHGQEFMCIDSAVKHDFTFTPAISLFVSCESDQEIERLFGELSRDGTVFMPLGSYSFSKRFGWLADRFGVSWQLNQP